MRPHQFSSTARAGRGVVLGSALFVLTASAHTAANGQLTSLTDALWLLPFLILVSAALADRRRTLTWLLAYLLGAEALSHVLLSLALGHDGHAMALVPSSTMVTAHVVAAAAAAVLIHQADALLHAWLRFVAALTRGALLSVPVTEAWPSTAIHLQSLSHLRRQLGDAHPRRGPPSVTA